MSKQLDGKVAIITGGASGMGLGSVRLFAEHGGSIVIADIQAERGAAVAAELGSQVVFRRTDVSNAADVESLIDFTIQRFGRLDVMFNNAGLLAAPGTIELIDDDFADFSHTLAVDLYGVMLGTRFAARAMSKLGGGSIINTASTTATTTGLGILSYRAAKAGVLNFTLNAAMALGKHAIRVNAISPGPIATDVLTLGLDLPAEKKEAIKLASFGAMMEELQPLKRLGMPLDIANAALFLASDKSAQITGINLTVSGGEHLGTPKDTTQLVKTAFLKALSS